MNRRTTAQDEPLMTPDEELELLALISAGDVETARADSHMTERGALLLLALLAGSGVAARYLWRPDSGAAGRYVDSRTGRYVASPSVRRELDAYLRNYNGVSRSLAGQLRDGTITLPEWELAMRRHIRNIHLNAVALERGGWAQMTTADFARVGQILRGEFGYLKNFAAQLASGKQRMDGTFPRRAQLYTEAGRATWYESKQANLRPELTHVRSIRTARDSCRECVELDHKWFRIGDPAYPLPGRRICGRNCACYEEYGSFNEAGSLHGMEIA